MNSLNDPNGLTFTPSNYEICIEGQLGAETAAWFQDMTVRIDQDANPPRTMIRGYLVDQAALYGLINRARDLGLTLLSVERLGEGEDMEPRL